MDSYRASIIVNFIEEAGEDPEVVVSKIKEESGME